MFLPVRARHALFSVITTAAAVLVVSACAADGEADAEDADHVTAALFFPDFDQAMATDFGGYLRGERVIPAGEAEVVVRAVVLELAKGPTVSEEAEGAYSPMPSAELVRSIELVSGVVIIDFDETITTQADGISTSHGGAAFVTSLALTVFQWPDVSSIELRLDGSCERFTEFQEGSGCNREQRTDWIDALRQAAS